MSANAKFRISLINLASLLLAMTATGIPAVKVQKLNLGAAYEKQERFEEGVEACLQAIKLKPDWAEAHYNLGVALSKLNRWAEAVEAFKQAVKIKSVYAEAHFNLGVACLNLGDQKAAKAAYDTLKTLDADLASRLLKLIVQ
jgi:tetratricopeptide (TPR) repeat protein